MYLFTDIILENGYVAVCRFSCGVVFKMVRLLLRSRCVKCPSNRLSATCTERNVNMKLYIKHILLVFPIFLVNL